jgi:Tfp pilus assembly protein PilF
MDGRRSVGIAAGLLAGMIGCKTPEQRQQAELARQTEATTQLVKSNQALAAAQVDLPPAKDRKLKPETLVKIGALKEQAAEDAERPQPERDAFRYQARQSYQKAIEQDPKYAPAYIELAGSYLQTGENDRANAVFDQALKANPKNGLLWFELGTVQARAKHWEASLESLSRAAQLDPDNTQFQKTYGLALARAGRFDESYDVMSKCMSESEARFNVARMLKHVGQPEACLQQLSLSLRANPNFAPAQELLDAMNRPSPVTPVNHEEPVQPPPVNGTGAGSDVPSQDGFDGTRK